MIVRCIANTGKGLSAANLRLKSWDSDLSGVWGYKELVASREYFDQLAEHDSPAIEDFHRQRERIDRASEAEED